MRVPVKTIPLVGCLYLVGDERDFLVVIKRRRGRKEWRGFRLCEEDGALTLQLMEGLLGGHGENAQPPFVFGGQRRRALVLPDQRSEGPVLWIVQQNRAPDGEWMTAHRAFIELRGMKVLTDAQFQGMPELELSFPDFAEI